MCGCFAGRQKMAILTSLLYYQGGCKAGVSLHIYPEQNFITRLRLLPRAWDENFELINVDSSRCFLKPNDIFKWQLFLSPPPLPLHSNTLWAILLEGGGGSLYNWWKWKIPLSSKNCWFDGDYIIFGSLHNLLVQYMLIKKKLMHCTCQFL